jgi:hypothetical protein
VSEYADMFVSYGGVSYSHIVFDINNPGANGPCHSNNKTGAFYKALKPLKGIYHPPGK